MITEHKYAIKKDKEYQMAKHKKSYCIVIHLPEYSIGHVNIRPTRKGNRELKLNQRETFWIYKLKANAGLKPIAHRWLI